MEGYKVIKDFSFAEKGDVFTKVEDLNLWELQKSEVISDTETYKQAGNSIVVNVLMALLRKIDITKYGTDI